METAGMTRQIAAELANVLGAMVQDRRGTGLHEAISQTEVRLLGKLRNTERRTAVVYRAIMAGWVVATIAIPGALIACR
jgi:hypothetical protein